MIQSLTAQSTVVGDPSLWAKHGIQGLVILALFVLIVLGFRAWMEERKGMQQAIKEATDNYRSDVKEMTQQSNDTIKEVNEKSIANNRETSQRFIDLHQKTLDIVTKQE